MGEYILWGLLVVIVLLLLYVIRGINIALTQQSEHAADLQTVIVIQTSHSSVLGEIQSKVYENYYAVPNDIETPHPPP